jgi:hypothetical protein
MSSVQRFSEFRMTEGQRTAFLERVRSSVSAEDYHLIEGMSHALPELAWKR